MAELSDELGIDPGDLTVLVTALGEHAVDELPDLLLADLLDVLDAKTRLRISDTLRPQSDSVAAVCLPLTCPS
jgi:hypothetical protein